MGLQTHVCTDCLLGYRHSPDYQLQCPDCGTMLTHISETELDREEIPAEIVLEPQVVPNPA